MAKRLLCLERRLLGTACGLLWRCQLRLRLCRLRLCRRLPGQWRVQLQQKHGQHQQHAHNQHRQQHDGEQRQLQWRRRRHHGSADAAGAGRRARAAYAADGVTGAAWACRRRQSRASRVGESWPSGDRRHEHGGQVQRSGHRRRQGIARADESSGGQDRQGKSPQAAEEPREAAAGTASREGDHH
jgi:hypothetical protein